MTRGDANKSANIRVIETVRDSIGQGRQKTMAFDKMAELEQAIALLTQAISLLDSAELHIAAARADDALTLVVAAVPFPVVQVANLDKRVSSRQSAARP